MMFRRNRQQLAASLALTLLASACACGGQSSKQSKPDYPSSNRTSVESGSEGESSADDSSMGESPEAYLDESEDPRERIARLSTQIGDWRAANGLPREPLVKDVAEAQGMPVSQAEEPGNVRAPTTQTCKSTCKVSAAICDNAEMICELAGDLGDSWSAEKCSSATASCKEASLQCSKCVASE